MNTAYQAGTHMTKLDTMGKMKRKVTWRDLRPLASGRQGLDFRGRGSGRLGLQKAFKTPLKGFLKAF